MMRAIVLAVAAVAAVACVAKGDASKAFSAAIDDTHAVFADFQRDFPGLEAKLEEAEGKDPAAGVRQIDTKLLPLFDRVIGAMDRAIAAGRHYLDVATNEDPSALASIRKTLDELGPRRDGYVDLRALYVDEEGLLAKGPLSDADQQRLGARMVEISERIAH
jgi:hypothetical protein